MKTEKVTYRLPVEVLRYLLKLAREGDRPVSRQVARLVRQEAERRGDTFEDEEDANEG